MEQLIKKIQKLREWEHLGLITTTGNTSGKDLNEFLLELENEELRLFAFSGRSEQLKAFADYAQKRMWEDEDKDLSEFVDEFLHL